MAKKLKNLESKLGSWTEQAALTRTQNETDLPPVPVAATSAPPVRVTYPQARSLMERIASVAAQQGMSQQAVVGKLLTWALDQVENGSYSLTGPTTDK